MEVLIFFVVFTCVVHNNWAIAKILDEVHPDPRFMLRTSSSVDCKQFSHDYEILSSLGFVTQLNPLSESKSKTYGKMDDHENVYYLNIANQRFVPKTVFCLKFLQELYVRSTSFYEYELDDDSIRQIPGDIARLAPTLRILGIYDSRVTHLPKEIGNMTCLYGLEFDNTDLVTLPDSIGNLPFLEYLYLPNNKLTSLPASLSRIQSLTDIMLYNNPKLRSVQSINGLPYLYYLNTNDCPIERLPLNLPHLYFLYMSRNNLTSLVGISSLGNNTGNNKYFYFNMNRIQFIPPQIRFVRNLYWLHINHNDLITLPTDIFNVSTLRYLDIRYNLFTGTELRAIVGTFNITTPSLELDWSNLNYHR